MEEREEGPPLPLRTLHDFLFEIDREWDRFRTGSLLSVVTSILLFLLFIPRFFLYTLRRGGPFDKLFAIAIIVALLYNAYLAWGQHQFYRRWEKRLGLLIHLEEKILEE